MRIQTSGDYEWRTDLYDRTADRFGEGTRSGEIEDGLLTTGCEHCDWATNASSHAALVEAYQDHLRESHPKIWLRT